LFGEGRLHVCPISTIIILYSSTANGCHAAIGPRCAANHLRRDLPAEKECNIYEMWRPEAGGRPMGEAGHGPVGVAGLVCRGTAWRAVHHRRRRPPDP